jgi:putative endonuclease
MFYVYIVRCSDRTYYTGYTHDLKNRVDVHNNGKGAKYTRGRLPVELVYFEEFDSKGLALSREYKIKKLSRKCKEELVEDFFRNNISI